MAQVHDISSDQINVSASVDSSICVENVALTSTNIITGAASVDNSSILQIHNVLSLSIDCACVVEPTSITQIHSITLKSIVSNAQVDFGRFFWQEEYFDAEIWTEQSVSSETWTDAA